MKERYGKSLSILLVAILLGSIFVLPINADSKLSFGEACDITTLEIEGILKPSEKKSVSGLKTEKVEFHVDTSKCDIYPMSDEFVYLKIGDLKPCTAPGEPQLPMETFVIKLQKNAKIVDVAAVNGKYRAIENRLKIVPVPQPYIWGPEIQKDQNAGKFIPNEEIYRSNRYFNGKIVSYDVGCDNEYKYVFVRVYPVQYIPAQRKAILIEDMTINVYYESEEESLIQELSESPQITSENIIIAPEELYTEAKDLAEFHEGKGISTEVVNTTWIYENYAEGQNPPYEGYKDSSIEGWDDINGYNYTLAKRTIAFLGDDRAHPDLKYVTLLGNARLVPPSYYIYFNVYPTASKYAPYNNWIPTDFFYSSPDYDLVQNYAIGRLPVNSSQEAEHVVQKIKAWDENVSLDWFKNVALIGGTPFWTYGSRYYVGELATTDCVNRGYLDGMNVTKLYLSDGNNRPEKVQSAYQGEYGFIYHDAHGSGDAMVKSDSHEGWVDVINTTILKDLSANSDVPIVLSVSCMNGAFDTNLYPNTIYGDTQPISFGEALLLSNAGGIACIGASRIAYGGWDVYLDNGYLYVTKEPYMQGMATNVFEAYHNGSNILGNMTKIATKKYVMENDFSCMNNNITLFEFTLLGDPALQLPPQEPGVSYQQPFLEALDPEYYTLDENKPFYNTSANITINSTTDSPTVFTKRINTFTFTTVESMKNYTKNNPSKYTFSSTNETEYLVRTSSEDGKEGWLYLSVAGPWKKSIVVLIVDDDGVNNYETYYEDALAANRYAYDTWNVALRGSPGNSTLAEYDVVVWFMGHNFPTLSTVNQANLTTYLDSGGKLFISEQDIGYDLVEEGRGEDFYHNYLHADYSTRLIYFQPIITYAGGWNKTYRG
jgi:hypothetical protein